MNQTEAVKIVAYLNRAGLLHAMEGQGAVWADALEFVKFEDAQDVAREFARTRRGSERWVTPGDIIDHAARLRASRVNGRTPPPPPPCIPHDNTMAQIAWTRTVTRHLADGLTDDEATSATLAEMGLPPLAIEAPRPVDALVKQVARAMPRIPAKADAHPEAACVPGCTMRPGHTPPCCICGPGSATCRRGCPDYKPPRIPTPAESRTA